MTFGDFNGDGATDVLRQESGGGHPILQHYYLMPRPDVVTTITLANEGVVGITYTPAPQHPGAVIPTSAIDLVNKIVSNNSPRYLALETRWSDPRSSAPPVIRKYQFWKGMRLRGYRSEQVDLGFRSQREIEVSTETGKGGSTLTQFRQDAPFQGMVDKITIFDSGTPAMPYRQTVYYHQLKQSVVEESNFLFVEREDLNVFDGLSDSQAVSCRKLFEYDGFGRLKSVTDQGIINNSGPFDPLAVVTEVYEYARNDTTNQSRTASKTTWAYDKNGAKGIASKTNFFYDHNAVGIDPKSQTLSKGWLTSSASLAETNPDKYIVTDADFNEWGNLNRSWNARFFPGTAPDIDKPDSTITYDDIYKAQVKAQASRKSDSVSFTTTTDYNALLLPVALWDINQQKTTLKYDVFGRMVETKRPLETAPGTKITYSDATAPGVFPRYLLSQALMADGSSLDTYTYYDGLGRRVQTKSEAVGTWVTQDWSYSDTGRNTRVSVPYSTPNAAASLLNESAWVNRARVAYAYDPLGRVISITNPDGTKKRTFYRYDQTIQLDESKHLTSVQTLPGLVTSKAHSGNYPSFAQGTALPSAASTITSASYRGLVQTGDSPATQTVETFDLAGRRTSLDTPDLAPGTVWSYQYFADGNLKKQTDPNGKVIDFLYDALGRLTDKSYSDGTPAVHYTYDQGSYGLGRLGSVTFARGQDAYTYDARGRVKGLNRTLDGLTRSVAYTYDSLDRKVTETLPSGEVLSYTYGADGNLVALKGVKAGVTTHYLVNATYTPQGKVKTLVYGNGPASTGGVTTTYNYYDDATLDPKTGNALSYRMRQVVAADSGPVMNFTYSYYADGNVSTKADLTNPGGDEEYSYDGLGRLTKASGSYGDRNYLYDALNNLAGHNGVKVNVYDPARPHTIISNGTQTYEYDDNGNLHYRKTSGNIDREYSYDAENRLVAAAVGTKTIGYSYDDNRQRTIMTEGTLKTLFWFAGYEETYTGATLVDATTSYRANGQKIAQTSTVTGLVYLFTDHLGSSSRTKDSNGVVRSLYYEPYGLQAATYDPIVREMFTGQQWDVSLNLYYYNARYYSATGRFTQPDPALWDGQLYGKANLTLQETVNPYLYALNNPVQYTDPSGLFVPLVVYGAVITTQMIIDAMAASAIVTVGTATVLANISKSRGKEPQYQPPGPTVDKKGIDLGDIGDTDDPNGGPKFPKDPKAIGAAAILGMATGARLSQNQPSSPVTELGEPNRPGTQPERDPVTLKPVERGPELKRGSPDIGKIIGDFFTGIFSGGKEETDDEVDAVSQ